MEKYYIGTLRVKPENLATSKAAKEALANGYIYAVGCHRFKLEVCTCCKCRKKLKLN